MWRARVRETERMKKEKCKSSPLFLAVKPKKIKLSIYLYTTTIILQLAET